MVADGRMYMGKADGSTVSVLTGHSIAEPVAKRPLAHIVKHSPSGFAWGYEGSGPAELARCLLIDALGDRAKCPTCAGTHRVVFTDPESARPATSLDDPWSQADCIDCDAGVAAVIESNYQTFKREHVAGWPSDQPWTLAQEVILTWVNEREAVSTRH